MRRTRTDWRPLRALLLGGAVLLGVTLGAPQALADDGAARAEARAHFSRGVTLAKQRNFADALSEFQQAYAAVPHFSVLYNMGQAQVALGQSAEAVATLQRYLDEGGAAVDAQRRAEVEQTLVREREKAPPPPAPPPGTMLQPAPAAGVPRAPGSDIPAGALGADDIVDLVPAAPATAAPAVALPPVRVARRPLEPRPAHVEPPRAKKASLANRRTLAYVVGATGLALTGGAVAHYLWNRGRYEDWQSQYATYFRDPTEPNRRAANALSDSINRASAVTVVLAVGAGAALGTSGLLWISGSPASVDPHARGFEPFFNVKGTF